MEIIHYRDILEALKSFIPSGTVYPTGRALSHGFQEWCRNGTIGHSRAMVFSHFRHQDPVNMEDPAYIQRIRIIGSH